MPRSWSVTTHRDEAASAIGSTIRLDDAPCEVIGVMPEGFGFRDDRVKVWTTLPIDTEETPSIDRVMGWWPSRGCATASTPEQADAQLQSLRGLLVGAASRSLREGTFCRDPVAARGSSSATSATRCCFSAAPCFS